MKSSGDGERKNVCLRLYRRIQSSKYLLLALICVAIFTDAYIYGSIVPYSPQYERMFGLTEAEVGLILGAFAIGSLPMHPVVGVLSDRFGPMYLFTGGVILLAIVTLVFAFAQALWLLIVARILQGVATAFTWSSGMSMVAETYPAEFQGTATGCLMVASNVGSMSGPPIAGFMLEYLGYYAPFMTGIALCVFDFGLRMLFISPFSKHAPKFASASAAVNEPQEEASASLIASDACAAEAELDNQLSVSPDGAPTPADAIMSSTGHLGGKSDHAVSGIAAELIGEHSDGNRDTLGQLSDAVVELEPVREFSTATNSNDAAPLERKSVGRQLIALAREPIVPAVLAYNLAFGLILTSLELSLPLHFASSLSAGPGVIGIVFGVANVLSGAASVTSGYLSDRVGRKRVFIAGGALAVVCAALLSLPTTIVTTAIVLSIYFIAASAGYAPIMAMMLEGGKRAGVGSGLTYGLFNMDYAIGTLIGPSIGGALLDALGMSHACFVLSAILFTSLLPWVVVTLVRRVRLACGKEYREGADEHGESGGTDQITMLASEEEMGGSSTPAGDFELRTVQVHNEKLEKSSMDEGGIQA